MGNNSFCNACNFRSKPPVPVKRMLFFVRCQPAGDTYKGAREITDITGYYGNRDRSTVDGNSLVFRVLEMIYYAKDSSALSLERELIYPSFDQRNTQLV